MEAVMETIYLMILYWSHRPKYQYLARHIPAILRPVTLESADLLRKVTGCGVVGGCSRCLAWSPIAYLLSDLGGGRFWRSKSSVTNTLHF